MTEHNYHHPDFQAAMTVARTQLIAYGKDVDAGRWQGYATEGRPDLVTRELLDYKIHVPVMRWGSLSQPMTSLLDALAEETGCNREWADEHFLERVGGVPLNPDPSYQRWPWWKGQESSKQAEGEKFTHTYSERFWPKQAGEDVNGQPLYGHERNPRKFGIRYLYGDLNDLVDQLVREPMGRQAVLPIFFPEDTGAVHEGRVPCTLHYAFMLRQDQLHMWYPIRSCDFVRHMADDLYLACRLLLWVLNQAAVTFQLRKMEDPKTMNLRNPFAAAEPGILHWTAYSLHYHKGDEHHVR